MGVAEHEFELSLGPKAVKWLLYDVGGARGQVRSYSVRSLVLFVTPRAYSATRGFRTLTTRMPSYSSRRSRPLTRYVVRA